MPAAKESSLLFALDELRDLESQRQVELRHIAHKQALEAKERARRREEEVRQRKKEEEEAAERRHADRRRKQDHEELEARSRRILEAQIAADARSIAALESRVRMHEATASHLAMPAPGSGSRLHALWAFALVAACAGVFLLADRDPKAAPAIASSPSEPVTPTPAIAPAPSDCPEPLVPTAQPAVAQEAQPNPPKQDRGDRSGGKRNHGNKKATETQAIKIDGCMDDPLGCMPE